MAKKQNLHRVRTIRRKKGESSATGGDQALPTGGPEAAEVQPTTRSDTQKAAPPAPSKPKPAPPPRMDPAKLQAELEALGPDPMAQLLGDAGPHEPEPGDSVTGPVVRTTKTGIFVDIGAKSEAFIERSEFKEPEEIQVGTSVTAFVVVADHRGIRLTKTLSGAGAREMLAEAQDSKIPVEGTVTGRNTGGFTVRMSGVEAFCPVSHIARHPVADLDSYIGQTLTFRIQEIRGRDVVVSRREIEKEAAAAAAEEAWKTLKVGDERPGTVTGSEAFGVFVDIGGIQGLVHSSELGWDRDSTPPATGSVVQVRILSIDKNTKRISLSMKDPSMGPWARVGTEFNVGTTTEGEVTRITDFGAFVQIAPGLEGLVHISEMSDNHVDHPRTVVRKGQKVQVRILDIERDRERISLSMKEPTPDWKPEKSGHSQSLGTFADLLGGLKLD